MDHRNGRLDDFGMNQGSMDLLLGPSTWDFRMAAAQVAEEFQMPLLLWSFPESLGQGWVLPTNTMAPWIFSGKIHGYQVFRVAGGQDGFSLYFYVISYLFSTCRRGLWGDDQGKALDGHGNAELVWFMTNCDPL